MAKCLRCKASNEWIEGDVKPQDKSEIERLRRALEASVKLQSHYAELLNMHDGGRRMTFTADTWIARVCRRR